MKKCRDKISNYYYILDHVFSQIFKLKKFVILILTNKKL